MKIKFILTATAFGLCLSSHSASWVTKFASNNVTITDIDNHILHDPSSFPQNNKLYLYTRNQGSSWPCRTWDIGAYTGWRPSGWNSCPNDVQRAKKNSFSSAFQADGTTIGWVTNAADLQLGGSTATAGNLLTSANYRFSPKPKPWAHNDGKLRLTTRLKIPVANYNDSKVRCHSKFVLSITHTGNGHTFFWQDKFYHKGNNPPSTETIHYDSPSDQYIVISKHVDQSSYHTRHSGSFKTGAFGSFNVFQITVSRSELWAALDDLNKKMDDQGSTKPRFDQSYGSYQINSFQVNTEMHRDDNGDGHHSVMLDHFKIDVYE